MPPSGPVAKVSAAVRLRAKREDAHREALARLPITARSELPARALDPTRSTAVDLQRELRAYTQRTGDARVEAAATLELRRAEVVRPMRLLSGRLLLELQRQISGQPTLKVTELQALVGGGAPTNLSQMTSVSFLARGSEAMRSVARITVPRFVGEQQAFAAGNPVVSVGTAWLLTPSIVITNHHVVNARPDVDPPLLASDDELERQCRGAQVEFDVDVADAVVAPVGVTELLHRAPVGGALDYAVLRLDREIVDRAPLTLARAFSDVSTGAKDAPAANIVQHPGGGAKLACLRNNLIAKKDGADLWYFTDTEQGSSGAPVFDDEWRVVGLHKAAGEHPKVGMVNLGTPIERIVADLLSKGVLRAEDLAQR